MPVAQPRVVSDIVRSQRDRKAILIQAKSVLQSLCSFAALAPAPGLSLCFPIVISIIESIDGTNSNQEECLRLAERVTEIFYAIINQTAEREGPITIGLDHSLSRLAETLEAVKLFIFQQKKRNYISKMWTHGGDTYAIRQLNIQLDNAMALFELKSHIAIQRKLEVLRLLLEGRGADGKTNEELRTSPANGAVGSTFLPPAPSIFYGRQEPVDVIVDNIISQEPARVVVLGAGGVGKTSLSLVVLHHPKIVESFKSNRWFIQCEGSSTPQGLVSAIANRLELSGDKLFDRIILFFETQRTALVLDNFETPWETAETRPEIENMLSRLAAIKTLTLLVTMRGSERPIGTAWTRPFVAPLRPLDLANARLTFVAISGGPEDDPYLEKLLNALDNLPLAITLMANLAQSETPMVLLKRWYSENTAMLTRGPEHRLSSLEISIAISLDGPRMRQNPDANLLLRILALLPQGSKDLEEIAPDIPNVHKAATVLKQVGLAHVDGLGSLRVLAPVRKFIVKNYPPDSDNWKSVQKHFETLATMSSEIERGMDGQAIVERLSPQTSSMQAVFERSLDIDGADFPRVIRAAIDLTDLFKYTGLGSLTTLIKSSQKAETIGDTALLADCIRSQAEIHYSRSSRELATAGFEKALSLYREMDGEHLSAQGRCTMMLGMVESQAGNYKEAIVYIEHAIEFHRRGKDVIGEADCLVRLAQNAICQQKYTVAIPCVNAAVRIYQTHTYLRGQARCKWLLGVISQERRVEYTDASETVADAALAYRFLGDVTGEANCLRILGRISLQTAKYGDAIQRLQTAMTLYRKVKRVYGEADCYQAQGEVYMGRRNEISAETNFKRAGELFSEIKHRGGKVFCTRALGDIAFRRRNYAEAKQIYEQVMAMSRTHIDKCRAEFGIANVALALDDDLRARNLYDKVLPLFQQHGHAVPDEAHTLKKLGDVAVKARDDEQAKDQFEQALVKFRVTGIVPAQADCLVRLAEVAMRQSALREAISRYEEAMGLYCEAEDEERRTLCSKALEELKDVVPRTSHQWVRLL